MFAVGEPIDDRTVAHACQDHAWAEYYRKLTALKSGIRAAAAPLPLALQRAIQSTGLANMDTDEDSAAGMAISSFSWALGSSALTRL